MPHHSKLEHNVLEKKPRCVLRFLPMNNIEFNKAVLNLLIFDLIYSMLGNHLSYPVHKSTIVVRIECRISFGSAHRERLFFEMSK